MRNTFHVDPIGYWIEKSPGGVLDYSIDWTDWLDGDTITGTPEWTLTPGLTKESQSNTGTGVTIWLSGGGVLGTMNTATCKISTTGGRTDERSFRIKIVNR